MNVPVLTLDELAAMVRAAMSDGRWADTSLGAHVAAYLDALEYAEASVHTLAAYEHVLALFAVEHADLSLIDLEPPAGGQAVRAFLDRHWRDAAPSTRRQRLAILRSFLTWMVGEGCWGLTRPRTSAALAAGGWTPGGRACRRGAADCRPA